MSPPQPDETAGAVVRVMLVDDHAIVREGYRRLLALEPDLRVVAEYASADAACQALLDGAAGSVDVVVLDVSMPGRSGLEALRGLRELAKRPRVLVFTMHDSVAMADQAMRSGADGFVTKASEPSVLVSALRRVAAGETSVLSDDVAQAALAHGARPGGQAAPALSPREFEVMQLLIDGLSIEQIGARLGLTSKTAANYQTLVRHKLGVATSIELLRVAERRGLVVR
jgi:DNA-binding NarL/FixJ family response regulator